MPVTKGGEFSGGKGLKRSAIDPGITLIGPVEGTQDMKQGAFPGAGGTNNTYNFPLIYLQVHPFNNLERAITFM